MTDTEVKINGKPAGPVHQGAFYAFKYDITKLLNYQSSNLLEVTVAKQSSNASVNAAERKGDFWIFGGIFRPVYLEALPVQHIDRVAIDAKANGRFSAEVFLTGSADKVSVQLYSSNGKKFGNAVSKAIGKQLAQILVSGKFISPHLWSPEFPNLYKAVFTLYQNGKILHTMSRKFGFRTIEVKKRDGVYVNGGENEIQGCKSPLILAGFRKNNQ